MNIAIVASHDIEITRDIASKVASFIVVLKDENEREVATWGDWNKISIRAPVGGSYPSSPVEMMAMKLAGELGLATFWVRPRGGGRAAIFDRDYSLVESAGRVLAFFRHDRLMEGGTGHVVHAALVRGIPVEAWVLQESGTLERVGSDDGFEVGEEGSRWMQYHYLEWQAAEAERLIQAGLIYDTATPVITTTSSVSSGYPTLITLTSDQSTPPY